MNNNYEDDIFEEAEENEEVSSEPKNKSERLLRICLAAVIVAVVVIAILASVVITMSKQNGDEETTLPDETTTVAEVITTSPAEKYAPGQYTVNVGGNGKLNLRKEPSKDGEQILAIDNGTLLTITEIKYDAEADEDTQYWGRTVYKGWDGWVSMKYLANAYSDNVVTPDEQTTAGEETTLAEEGTTVGSEATTAANEQTTAATVTENTTAAQEATTSSGASSAFATGTYTVTADPHLNMREDHDVSSLSIAQVPVNSTVTIVEVYYDEDSTNEYTKYWGKTTFGGITGWVAMGYLQ